MNLYVQISYIVMAGLVFIIFTKLATNRILVEKLYIVKNGLVVRNGRYRIDNKNNCLRAMFGPDKLPLFPEQYYQKVNGAPILGLRRVISVVFKNKYSPMICLPTDNKENIGEYKDLETRRWYYTIQRNIFLKQFNKTNIAYILTVYAPLVIIIFTIGFFIYMLFIEKNAMQDLSNKIDILITQIETVIL